MKYKAYIVGKAKNGEEEILYKKTSDLLDQAISELATTIPHLVSRKDVELIIIKKVED